MVMAKRGSTVYRRASRWTEKPLPHIKARDFEILALRSEGLSPPEIAQRYKLAAARVRQIIQGRPSTSTAQKLRQDQAYAQLAAVNGIACIESGMSVDRLAAIAGTTPRRVEKWLLLEG